MSTGLILGKFYPPHNGHHYLIDEAQKRCDVLHVLIWFSNTESIPGNRRYDILKEMHPGANIWSQQCEIVPDYGSDDVWSEHMELLKVTFPYAEEMFDYVFTSEEYGDELALRLNAEHICIDPARTQHPISGTAIRNDPAANWNHLAEPTRALLTKRFVVTGAESTGSTTLTKALAQHYGTVWVPEYGRFYTEGSGLGHRWETNEFEHIVEGQHLAEDFLARKAGPIMFCDTDALSTAVWHERYTWKRSKHLESLIRSGKHYQHYFITDYVEVPFEDDGLRDGDNTIRLWMENRIIEMINERRPEGPRCNVMLGGPKMRLAHAIDIVDKYIVDGWYLNPPLGE